MTRSSVEFGVQSRDPFGGKSMQLVNSFMKELLNWFKDLFFQPKTFFFSPHERNQKHHMKNHSFGLLLAGEKGAGTPWPKGPLRGGRCRALQKLIPGKESLGGEGRWLVLFSVETHWFRPWPLRILFKLAIRLNFIFVENSSQNHMSLTSPNYSFSL